ncbi:MAG: hypothetical protein V8Q79_02860 [Christensenellales bacterium]
MQKTYTETFPIQETDCDLHGRMRLDALFIAMQEGGERHAIALGAGYAAMQNRGLFFALARIHVAPCARRGRAKPSSIRHGPGR